MKRHKITYDKVLRSEGGLNIEDAVNDILINGEGFIKLFDGTFLKKGVQFNLAFSTQAISVNFTKENPLSDPTLYLSSATTSTGIIQLTLETDTTCTLTWDSVEYPITHTSIISDNGVDKNTQIRSTVEANLGNWKKVVCYKSADIQDVSYMVGNGGLAENFQIRYSDPVTSFISYDTTETSDAGARGKLTWITKDDSRICSLFIHDEGDSVGVWFAAPFLIPKTQDSAEIWEGFYKCGFVQKENGDIIVTHSSPLSVPDTEFQYTTGSYYKWNVSNCNFFSNSSEVYSYPTHAYKYIDNLLQFYSKRDNAWYYNNFYGYMLNAPYDDLISENKISLPYLLSEVTSRPYKICNLGIFSALQTSSGVGYTMMPIVLTQYTETGQGTKYRPKQKIVCNDVPFIYMTSPKDAEDGSDLRIGSRHFQMFTGALADGSGREGFYNNSLALSSTRKGGMFQQGFAFEITDDNTYTG